MEQEKEVIEAEVVEDKEKKEKPEGGEKKESGFGKWWKGVKKSANDAMLEAHIESAWNKAHHSYTITAYSTSLFGDGATVFGDVENGALTIFGKAEIKPFSVVIDSKDKKAYYVVKAEPTKVKITYESTDYERDGQVITLDEKVEEVRVIKADGRYFLYKGPVESK